MLDLKISGSKTELFGEQIDRCHHTVHQNPVVRVCPVRSGGGVRLSFSTDPQQARRGPVDDDEGKRHIALRTGPVAPVHTLEAGGARSASSVTSLGSPH